MSLLLAGALLAAPAVATEVRIVVAAANHHGLAHETPLVYAGDDAMRVVRVFDDLGNALQRTIVLVDSEPADLLEALDDAAEIAGFTTTSPHPCSSNNPAKEDGAPRSTHAVGTMGMPRSSSSRR